MILSLSKPVLLQLLIRHWKSDMWVNLNAGQIDSLRSRAYNQTIPPRMSDQTNEQSHVDQEGLMIILYHLFFFL